MFFLPTFPARHIGRTTVAREISLVYQLLLTFMGFEKIIVLDDELIIRKSLEEQLRRKRYSVSVRGLAG